MDTLDRSEQWIVRLLARGFDLAQVKKEDLATKNTKSPGAETSVTINGKNLWIYYHAPSVRGRHIFNGAGALQPDGSVWRLGADYATVLHTDAEPLRSRLHALEGRFKVPCRSVSTMGLGRSRSNLSNSVVFAGRSR